MFRAQELNVRAEVERLQRMLGGLAQLWHSEEVREIAGRLAGQCQLLQNKVDLLDWPPHLPDMNPIENL